MLAPERGGGQTVLCVCLLCVLRRPWTIQKGCHGIWSNVPASDKVAAGQRAVNVEAAGLQELLTQVSIGEQRSGPTRPDFLLISPNIDG